MKHGHNRKGRVTRTYRSWAAMRTRCTNPRQKDWHSYGGRGISVCSRWDLFENFLADMGECPSGHTLDRINSNGNYEPSNCRWATPQQQSRNTKRTVLIEFAGRRLCLKEWATEIGIPYGALYSRIRYGWPLERVLTEPSGLHQGRHIVISRETAWSGIGGCHEICGQTRWE